MESSGCGRVFGAGRKGVGGSKKFFVFVIQIFNDIAKATIVEGDVEFVLGVVKGFAHAVHNAKKGIGRFGGDFAIGDEGEEAAKDERETGAGDGLVSKWFGEKKRGVFRFLLLADLGEVCGAIGQGTGAEEAAAAAVDVGIGAHAGAMFGGDSGHRSYLGKVEWKRKTPGAGRPRAQSSTGVW